MNTIVEFLFYLLGGVPIAATPWIILWVVFWSLAMTWPVLIRQRKWTMAAFNVSFVFGVIMALAPPMAQMQVMSDCRTFETEVSSDLSEPKIIALRECSRKDNYYGGFGPWTISQGPVQ
jgi:hypothetical protein